MPLYALGDLTPQLPEDGDFWIAPDAHVIGRVRIGKGANIWFGAVLRGDNELIDIGAGTNIQEGAMLHTDMGFPLSVGEFCTVGHHAILHGCTVGTASLVGMGASLLNGARIGSHSLVGAGALVTEGKTFEDGSLIVGAPAKTVRRLDEAAIARLRMSARHYEERARLFARALKRID